MKLPTDLHVEIAERVDPSGFDEVLARAAASRRRRRTTIASGVAAAVAVVGVASWGPGRLGQDDPGPAGSGPDGTSAPLTGAVDERLPAGVRELLGSERIDIRQVVGSGGAIAALWSACDSDDACRFAVATRLGERVAGSLLDGPTPTIAEVPDGWLVQDGSGTFRLAPDGERAPVSEPGSSQVAVEAGDTAVETAAGWRLLRGDKLIAMPTPAGADALAAHVTPAGDLVVATRSAPDAVEVAWTDASGSWRTGYRTRATEPVAAAVLAGHHDGVAIALLGDSPDGSVPVLEVAVSGDVGQTWTSARGLTGLRDLSGLAVSDEGTAYLTTGSQAAIRVDTDGNATSVGQSAHDHSVFLVSHRVCLVAEAGTVDELRCSADDGTTWTPMPLPGFR